MLIIIIQDTYTKTPEQQVQLPAQLHLLHAILAVAGLYSAYRSP